MSGKRKSSICMNDVGTPEKRVRTDSSSTPTAPPSPWEAKRLKIDLIAAKAQVNMLSLLFQIMLHCYTAIKHRYFCQIWHSFMLCYEFASPDQLQNSKRFNITSLHKNIPQSLTSNLLLDNKARIPHKPPAHNTQGDADLV